MVRCRLVARDLKKGDKDRGDLFAATPPLEALRFVLSKAATRDGDGAVNKKLMFMDAKKAHLNSRCEEKVYIVLPDEANHGPGKCGRLNFWLYGFRPAAQAWEDFYSRCFREVGFTRGMGCPVVFRHVGRDIDIAVHGDDFVVAALPKQLHWIREKIESWFETKVRGMLGPDAGDDKQITFLGRIVEWTESGIEFQADPKHRQMVIDLYQFNDRTKAVVTNGVPLTDKEMSEMKEGEKLNEAGSTRFRATVARLNFLSQDCPQIQFAVKGLSRHGRADGCVGHTTEGNVPIPIGMVESEVRISLSGQT